ncbi:glycosyltransferase family 2 protein [Aestuariispira insulae]|uniref:Glycosyltransferase involved in cell wall biosynthesis n=1 Tax=Aestuariispira insulae TaxID=1461337 RepID=A0A3D9HRW2_9PROT|nr:glycosyltransferase family 2 protein [Aestuariispira insulae]RED52254.1 glycosyltransferase involved in cell wall biosynthesis [Aestuariispira insulae]
MSKKLSALVVAHNEEKQLAACLETLRFADELVVVLDKCTDGSKEIAERFGAITIEGSWPIEGHRRNTGLDASSGDWILELDADERVTDALADEIRTTINKYDDGYFLVPFDNYIGDHRVRYGWGASWGVSAAPRLSARGAKRWGDQRIHPALTLKGPKRMLSGRIDHYVDRNITDMLKRLDSYSTAKARDLRENPDGIGYARNIRRMFSRFFKCYVSRKGYREGKYGFLIALMAALYPILSYLKAQLEDE